VVWAAGAKIGQTKPPKQPIVDGKLPNLSPVYRFFDQKLGVVGKNSIPAACVKNAEI
jgi:hypothetical protein